MSNVKVHYYDHSFKEDSYYPTTVKKLYPLDVFAALTTKTGTKIVPTFAKYNFSD